MRGVCGLMNSSSAKCRNGIAATGRHPGSPSAGSSGCWRNAEAAGRVRSHDGSVERAEVVEAVVQLTPARGPAPHHPGVTGGRGESGREMERAGRRR